MGERPSVLPVSRVTLGVTRWRAKVVVLDKTDVQTSKRGHRTQKVLLQDDQGTIIEAILWNTLIGLFEHTLDIGKTYVVGEVTVQPIKEEYRFMSPKMDVEWVLRPNTIIRAVTEEAEIIPYPLLHSMPHRDIVAFAGTKTPVDVIVAVVGINTSRDVTMDNKSVPVQELTVVDQSLNQFTISLWGEYVHKKGTIIRGQLDEIPVIMCRRLLARTYAGGSLSTVPFSYILIAPNLPQAERMKQWVHNNLSAIKQIGQPGARIFIEKKKEKTQEIGEGSGQLADVVKETEIEGTMSILDITQEVAYCTCRHCFEVTLEYKQDRFICNKCHRNAVAQPRCKLVVLLEDRNDMMTATLFDDNVEQLLQYKVDQLHCIDADRTQMLLEKARDALDNKKIAAKIVPHTKKCFDGRTIHTIQDWKYIEETDNNEPGAKEKASNLEDPPEKREGKRVMASTEATEGMDDDEENQEPALKKAKFSEVPEDDSP